MFLYQRLPLIPPFLIPLCVRSCCLFLHFQSLHISSILELIIDCLRFSSHAHCTPNPNRAYMCRDLAHRHIHTHTRVCRPQTAYAVHTQRSPSLDFIREFFMMAGGCAHKSLVPWWKKNIHNKMIKVKQ